MLNSDHRLHVHVIGSRGFRTSLAVGTSFADSLLFHNYEPDGDANDQTMAFFDANGLQGRMHTMAVMDRKGVVDININYDPYTSSARRIADRYRSLNIPYNLPAGDYLVGKAASPVRTVTVPCDRLDNLAERPGVGIDFVAMDTQGTEYEILTGAERCAASTMLGFSSEVEFHEIYDGQKLFGDIAALAARHGFMLAQLDPHPQGSFLRAPFGWRGKGFTVAGDALFLKSADTVRAQHPDPWLGLHKLAFISICTNMVEHALDCLEAAAEIGPGGERPPLAYLAFLDRLLSEYRSAPRIYPVAFTDSYGQEDSFARFAADRRDRNEDKDRTAARYFAHTDRGTFEALLPDLLSLRSWPLEALLWEQGFTAQADLAAGKRTAMALECALSLGLLSPPVAPLARAGRAVGRRLARDGSVAFCGQEALVGAARALLDLPADRVAGNHGAAGLADAADLETASAVVLCASGAGLVALRRQLHRTGFKGWILAFEDLLQDVCDAVRSPGETS